MINEEIDGLQELTDETIQNLRRLTRALRPTYLEDLGLVTALEMLASENSNPHLIVRLKCSGNVIRLSIQEELALYRMVQEALNNVARHAEASQAELRIVFEKDTLDLSVIDDGQGFTLPESPAAFAPTGHFGLLGLHERAEMIGAKLSIQSEPGKGTKVTIVLPIHSENINS